MKRYNPKDIEPKWQKKWQQSEINKTVEDADKPKRYVLEYFPYPSGAAMHVGHVRNYTIGDAIARFSRMRGYNVLHPMGWDAFGLPAENYAIKNNISPADAIKENTAKFKQQLIQMGFSYDWSREINSSDPSYYKWTQWFFALLFNRGLAYQKESLQWWCETDKTVLANEQVEAGKCWRCGNTVTKKPLKQWFFKITDYADRLIEDLDDLDWSESIKSMQRNWIGKSIGAEVEFAVANSNHTTSSELPTPNSIRVFTTRPDTLFGATFMVLSPEHPLVKQITTKEQKKVIEDYIKQAQSKSDVDRMDTDREKTGVFTGAYAINPVNNQQIPIWIADYVLMGYGTGAIMAVPAHDQRDYAFAKKFNLPITQVIMPCEIDPNNPPKEGLEEVERDTVVVHLFNKATGKYALLDWHETLEGISTAIMGGIEKGQTAEEAALTEIREEAGLENVKIIKKLKWVTAARYCASHKGQNRKAIAYGLMAEVDDLSGQKEVGESETRNHTVTWVDKKEVLEHLTPIHQKLVWEQLNEETALAGEGEIIYSGKYNGLTSSEAREKIVADLAKKGVAQEKVNYKIRDWLISRQRYWGAPIPIIHCPEHGAVAVPESELPVKLPPVKSYQPTGEGTSVLAGVKDWVNTTCPECGKPAKRETDTMDGFACSSWYFLRFADPHNDKQAFTKDKVDYWLPVDDYIGGAEHAVMHLLYARMWTKVIHDAGLIDFDEPFKALRNQGMILAPDGRKMSKSWGNTITPDEIIEQGYGADSVRLMELFIGPWNQEANWSVEGLGGCYRFLNRVWVITQKFLSADTAKNNTEQEGQLLTATHQVVKKVSSDLENMGFNTAISALMEFTNELYKIESKEGFVSKDAWESAINSLVQLLAPFAPHISEELWQQLGQKESVHLSDWPVHDEAYLVQENVTIAIQVNGKLRGEIDMPKSSEQSAVEEAAKLHENAALYVKNTTIKKVVYVPDKIINFVI